MPRSKKPIPKRQTKKDPIYNNQLVTRFINKIMKDGKKALAQKIVYAAFEKIKKQTGDDPIRLFETAITYVAPRLEVKPRRIGGASYQVPIEVRGSRRESLAIRWIIEAARKKPNKDFIDKDFKYPIMASKLAAELIEAANGQGGAVARKEDIQRVAEANRAFAHFRW